MLPNKNILYKKDNPMDALVVTLLQTLGVQFQAQSGIDW